MKIIRYCAFICFALILLIPLLLFNFEEEAVSEIDNRNLAGSPFAPEAAENDFTDHCESYVNDRIGLRDEMVLAYTVLNDKLFSKMVHPLYVYGSDGYVFAEGLTSSDTKFTEFHAAFADMVKEIQDYCDARDIPFVFVFDPAKPAVLTEYIPKGINYDRSWVDDFMAALDERGIRYVDNTETLREKVAQGEIVFNQKYDANHWNDLGAYYGTAAVFKELQKDYPDIQIYSPEDFDNQPVLQTTLPVSKFPINELTPYLVPEINPNMTLQRAYGGIQLNPSYRGFGYYTNDEQIDNGAPKALVFQGSYWNKFSYRYCQNAFSEYIHVHDYQNVIDFDYYFNIFKPDVVIFEVAEYTILSGYFDYERMCAMGLNPTLEDVLRDADIAKVECMAESMSVEQVSALTNISWTVDGIEADYAWFYMNGVEYDMKKTETGYKVTVVTENYDLYKDDIRVFTVKGDAVTEYIFAPAQASE